MSKTTTAVPDDSDSQWQHDFADGMARAIIAMDTEHAKSCMAALRFTHAGMADRVKKKLLAMREAANTVEPPSFLQRTQGELKSNFDKMSFQFATALVAADVYAASAHKVLFKHADELTEAFIQHCANREGGS